MKRNILLLIILTVISIGASGQKYTIYVDDFDSEIKVPNRAINMIRLAFIDGIRNTNRVNVVDAVSAGSDLSLSPLEDARRFKAEYLLKGNVMQREATDDGSSHRRYHSRENSYKEKFTLRLDLIRTSDGVTISTRNYEETGSASGKDATQYSAIEHSLINVPYEMGLFVENYFKVYGSILKVVSTKREKAKTIYINLGYDDPIKAGLRFDVVENGMLEGHYTETKIGEVRIAEIMGPNISLCKVNKGGATILAALNEGKTLKLISRQAKLFDE
ncbi:hypothetical protein [Phocaeicola sartorii]|uniref:hypothetical protein n=1 Tax=Phocaeicola sartorii TaxID=671267 RepID=UPI0024308D56|nr:hypothetical protein [Phocaeicola sartorii]